MRILVILPAMQEHRQRAGKRVASGVLAVLLLLEHLRSIHPGPRNLLSICGLLARTQILLYKHIYPHRQMIFAYIPLYNEKS